mmetsp:Transcript_33488/g.32554  ORF Transcript_33488/g.32554 Transcript_33488/m.32554 type:complete len:95 (+) Transcript_33488:2731-3015(+)
METTFVVSVKFAPNVKLFITATSKGEVKLWGNRNCDLLAVLNTPNYENGELMEQIQEVHMVEKQKELEREEQKQKKKIQENVKKLSGINSYYQR